MPAPRPQLRPSHTTGAANGHASRYVSHCTNCERGIFDWHAYHWSRDPLGYIHNDCDNPAGGDR